MVRVRPDFFGRLLIVFKLLIPMFLLMVIVAVVMFDGLKQPGQPRLQDLALFVYAMLFALFGFVALLRSHLDWLSSGFPTAKARPTCPCICIPESCGKSKKETRGRYDNPASARVYPAKNSVVSFRNRSSWS